MVLIIKYCTDKENISDARRELEECKPIPKASKLSCQFFHRIQHVW